MHLDGKVGWSGITDQVPARQGAIAASVSELGDACGCPNANATAPIIDEMPMRGRTSSVFFNGLKTTAMERFSPSTGRVEARSSSIVHLSVLDVF